MAGRYPGDRPWMTSFRTRNVDGKDTLPGRGTGRRGGNANSNSRQEISTFAASGYNPRTRGSRRFSNFKYGDRKSSRFDLTKLIQLLNQEESEKVIMEIGANMSEWINLLDNITNESHDLMCVVIHILAKKICCRDTILGLTQTEIITKTFAGGFVEKLQNLIGGMVLNIKPGQAKVNDDQNSSMGIDTTTKGILASIHELLAFVTRRCPALARDYISRLIPNIIGVLFTLSCAIDTPVNTTLMDLLKNFREMLAGIQTLGKHEEDVNARKRAAIRQAFAEADANMHFRPPPDDISEIEIVPSLDEILSTDEPFLRTNKINGGYGSAEHYRDVQFRLLREDLVRPFKTGIQDYLQNKDAYLSNKKRLPLGTIKMYPNTKIGPRVLVWNQYMYNVILSPLIYKRFNWDKSKRLINGSLLVFTSNNFRSAFFALVTKRDVKLLQTDGVLGITWEGDMPSDQSAEFLMIESEVYFEAYRHTLQTLQQRLVDLDDFPMAKFIIQASNDVRPPKYLQEYHDRNGKLKVWNQLVSPLAKRDEWPSIEELGMDENQFVAFHAALTQEFTLIQGPPGTGKTYVGLKIVECLLENLTSWQQNGSCPILVVCFTNHALDQFLEGILKILRRISPIERPGIIRVGGRCTSTILDEYGLFNQELRYGSEESGAQNQTYYDSRKRALEVLRKLENTKATVVEEVNRLRNSQGNAKKVMLGTSLSDSGGNLELGLITFKSLSYYDTLKGFVPNIVLDSLKSLQGLGLSEDLFLNFDTISSYYGRVFNPKPKHCKPVCQPQVKIQVVEPVHKDGLEDYDLDEILGNRIICNGRTSTGVGRITGVSECKLRYLNSYCTARCRKIIELAEAKLNEPETFEANGNYAIPTAKTVPPNEKNTPEVPEDPVAIQLRIDIEKNRIWFLKSLKQDYEADRLRLEDMSRIFQKDRNKLNKISAKEIKEWTIIQKWSVYFETLRRACHCGAETIKKINDKLVQAQKKVDAINLYGYSLIVKKAKVVGMTTTGAAKYNELIHEMKSKIVIVEEAAEVLEAHIVTALTKHCEHLILIGDHQQLRPNVTVYELSKRYNLEISLFERMLNNNLNCYKLKVQHRMRPEIANLIVDTIYNDLTNHDSVFDYPMVKGMDKNLFFLDHNELESSERDSLSKSNEFEAHFLACLCRHLILQGYTPSQITVLATYTGQMFLLKKEIRKFPSCEEVPVSVVDNFQGEENIIILLSLVRSNDEGKIGFLSISNRVCVALSRAKHGLYICGNMKSLRSCELWKAIEEKLQARKEIGNEIQTVCQNHGRITSIRSGFEFITKAADGGCDQICEAQLKCIHLCQRRCHGDDLKHLNYNCVQPCIKYCVRQHPCRKLCHQDCGSCQEKVTQTLMCQHEATIPCHLDPTKFNCIVVVDKVKPCGHVEDMVCHKNPAEIKCRETVVKKLGCGHEKSTQCHQDPDLLTCKVMVTKTLEPCGHEHEAACHLQPDMISCLTEVELEFPDCKHKVILRCKDKGKTTCQALCDRSLACGHRCGMPCHMNCDPEHGKYKCKEKCAKECRNGHTCQWNHECCEQCPECLSDTNKVLSCGTHTILVKCNKDVANIQCKANCERLVPDCNHICTRKCCEPCEPCQTIVTKTTQCGHPQEVKCSELPSDENCVFLLRPRTKSACSHEVEAPCNKRASASDLDLMQYCQHPCGYQFEDENERACHHQCKGSCSSCFQGRIHKKCLEICGRPLVCGHACSSPCSAACPPCKQDCLIKCEHSKCNKECGQICSPCKETCTWNCEHLKCTKLCGEECDRPPCNIPCPKILICGHACIGFCGETCPPHCRLCDKDKLTEYIFFGFENEEFARFVYLENCGHSIEVQGLTHYMEMASQGNEIGVKCCPRCKTPITHSRRYTKIIRETLEDVTSVKKVWFGNQKIVFRKQETLVAEMKQNEPWIADFAKIFPDVMNFLWHRLVIPNNSVNPQMQEIQNRPILRAISENEATSLDLVFKFAKNVGLNVFPELEKNSIKEDDRQILASEYTKLFNEIIQRSLPFSKTELMNFNDEFDRLFDLYQIYQRRNQQEFLTHEKAKPIYDMLLDIIFAPHVYSQGASNAVHDLLKDLDAILETPIGITERERVEIVSAFGATGQGRFYKCPNGHPCMIGNCGGANQVSKCNECGAAIGSSDHRVLGGNTFAPDLSGASGLLWPQ